MSGVQAHRETSAQGERGMTRRPPDPGGERRRLLDLWAQAPAAMAVLEGPDHVYTLANPLYIRLIGGRDVIGRPVRDAVPELDADLVAPLDECYTAGHAVTRREARLHLGPEESGGQMYVDFAYQPLRGPDGRTSAVLVHAVDVTESVRNREALTAARLRAEEANRAKAAFLAAVSHDVRTPLTAATGFVSLLLDGVYGAPTVAQREALARIQAAHTHLLGLIEDILQFAKLDAGVLDLEIDTVDVGALLDALGPLIELQLAQKELAYRVAPLDAPIHARADAERVRQILLNLLTNAVKFTPAGAIGVSAEARGDVVAIRVRDSGPGIAREDQERIFEPFVQTGDAAASAAGVGLGLAISRTLARSMAGDLVVESEPGNGAVFTLTLPRADAPAPSSAAAPPPAVP